MSDLTGNTDISLDDAAIIFCDKIQMELRAIHEKEELLSTKEDQILQKEQELQVLRFEVDHKLKLLEEKSTTPIQFAKSRDLLPTFNGEEETLLKAQLDDIEVKKQEQKKDREDDPTSRAWTGLTPSWFAFSPFGQVWSTHDVDDESAVAMLWDDENCSVELTLDEGKRTATVTSEGGNWCRVLGTVPNPSKFKVRIENVTGGIMVGFSPANDFADSKLKHEEQCLEQQLAPRFASNLGSDFLVESELSSTKLADWGEVAEENDVDKELVYKAGDVVSVCLDKTKNMVSFAVNGKSYGNACEFVRADDEPLFASVCLSGLGTSVSIVN